MKIIGIEEKEGVYEGTAYHNIHFHGTEPFSNDKSAGLKTKEIKVKHKILSENFGKALTTKEILTFVGKEVAFYYDEYKNVNFVQVETAGNG
ncbi:MAG: hypothetical protein FWG72_08805 [Oscillospiraceae bacterium]|nr:hypothetical protein [Oscillospiraceae bacterium]